MKKFLLGVGVGALAYHFSYIAVLMARDFQMEREANEWIRGMAEEQEILGNIHIGDDPGEPPHYSEADQGSMPIRCTRCDNQARLPWVTGQGYDINAAKDWEWGDDTGWVCPRHFNRLDAQGLPA